jgi:hypothetical protein
MVIKNLTKYFYMFCECSPCKWKFGNFPIVYAKTIGSYPFANRSNGINGSAHQCMNPAHSSIILETS